MTLYPAYFVYDLISRANYEKLFICHKEHTTALVLHKLLYTIYQKIILKQASFTLTERTGLYNGNEKGIQFNRVMEDNSCHSLCHTCKPCNHFF